MTGREDTLDRLHMSPAIDFQGDPVLRPNQDSLNMYTADNVLTETIAWASPLPLGTA